MALASVGSMIGDGGDRDRDTDIEDGHHVKMNSEINNLPATSPAGSPISHADDQIIPLLEKPKINIFSVSYARRKQPIKEPIWKQASETSLFLQSIRWIWSGSRYSGLLCMALSSIIYCVMEVISDVFTVQSIPLFEITFARCTVLLILSLVWLRRSGQSISGSADVRHLLALRALMGFVSLSSFIFCIQSLPMSQAVILCFTMPIMASTAARLILHEKLKIAEIGGLSCSFFGALLIFQPMLKRQGGLSNADKELHISGSHHLYAVLLGLFSSIAGGISYCLVRATAKVADQPVLTVFSFALLATPAAGLCTFVFQEFVIPNLYTLLVMIILGALAFLAEVTSARGLQLEKTSRVANIQYIEAALSQFLGMALSRIVPSFGKLVGCSLILISVCCTICIGPGKEIE